MHCFLLAVSILLAVYVPGRLTFLQECRAPEIEKKATLSGKASYIIAFFSIVQSNERRGGPPVVVTKVYCCLEIPETFNNGKNCFKHCILWSVNAHEFCKIK